MLADAEAGLGGDVVVGGVGMGFEIGQTGQGGLVALGSAAHQLASRARLRSPVGGWRGVRWRGWLALMCSIQRLSLIHI